jgi:hypothetical protein
LNWYDPFASQSVEQYTPHRPRYCEPCGHDVWFRFIDNPQLRQLFAAIHATMIGARRIATSAPVGETRAPKPHRARTAHFDLHARL